MTTCTVKRSQHADYEYVISKTILCRVCNDYVLPQYTCHICDPPIPDWDLFAMSLPTVRITYNLCPPASAQTPENLSQNKTHEFPVVREDSQLSTAYYTGLQKALTQAKEVLGGELTAWRDAVGNLEKDKDLGNSQRDEEEENDEDDEIAEIAESKDASTW